MEEIMNNEVMNETMEMAMEPVANTGGFGKFVAGAVVVLAGVGGALLYKNRNKLEERRIKKLEKKGYIIRKIENGELVNEDPVEAFED